MDMSDRYQTLENEGGAANFNLLSNCPRRESHHSGIMYAQVTVDATVHSPFQKLPSQSYRGILDLL
jgi:hypothetical protein